MNLLESTLSLNSHFGKKRSTRVIEEVILHKRKGSNSHGDLVDRDLSVKRLKNNSRNTATKVLEIIEKSEGDDCGVFHENVFTDRAPKSCSKCPGNFLCSHQDVSGITPLMEYTVRVWHHLGLITRSTAEKSIGAIRAYAQMCLNMDVSIRFFRLAKDSQLERHFQGISAAIQLATGKAIQSQMALVFKKIQNDVLGILKSSNKIPSTRDGNISYHRVREEKENFISDFWEIPEMTSILAN